MASSQLTKGIVKKNLKMEDYFYLDGKGLLYHIVPTNKRERAQVAVPQDLRKQLIK